MFGHSTASSGRKGQAVIETALILPWLVISFMATFDAGMYSYGLISTESAARVAAVYASQSAAVAANPTSACAYALAELRDAPGVGSASTCTSAPVTVSATYVASCADTLPCAQVTVTYQTPTFLPLPGVMSGSFAIARTVQFPIR
jgi:Flp pilus assembly protein TadG